MLRSPSFDLRADIVTHRQLKSDLFAVLDRFVELAAHLDDL